jgi:hypothetical protein
MIVGKEIPELVRLLESRGSCLYHACQLVDFKSYLNLGGIPSRAHLEQMQETFTPFETDAIDRENNVWDKVFANLSDYGQTFARGGKGVPNAFGPIALQIQPAALLEARDVAICLRSAGAVGFNRGTEALKSIYGVDELFVHPSDVGFPESTFIKYSEHLQTLRANTASPEVSCSVEDGFIPIEYVIVAWVDPYVVAGNQLLASVLRLRRQFNRVFPVHSRRCTAERGVVYGQIVERIMDSTISIRSWIENGNCSHFVRDWGQSIIARDLEYQFNRFAKYLHKGTISVMESNT